MKRKIRSKSAKIILAGIFCVGIIIAGYYFLFLNQDRSGNTVVDNAFGWKFPVAKFPLVGPNTNLIAYSDIRDPGGVPRGLPVRLQIPAIGVNSTIEDAQITSDGRMDVPSGSVNVAWFSLGPHPGQTGSAVIGGHFGIKGGVPFVFYNLDKLGNGDKVYIVNDLGETLAFIVRRIESFDRNADATTVFTSGDGLAHLNLITCEGIWNQVNDSYPDRLVVFTDAIPSEGPIVVKSRPTQTPLVSPTPSSSTAPKPNPTIASSSEVNSTVPPILTLSVGSLFATSLDKLVTSSLLISIAFMLFKLGP